MYNAMYATATQKSSFNSNFKIISFNFVLSNNSFVATCHQDEEQISTNEEMKIEKNNFDFKISCSDRKVLFSLGSGGSTKHF